MFSWRNKKDICIFRMKKAPYLLLCIVCPPVCPIPWHKSFVCLCWCFTANSTQWGHVVYLAGLVLWAVKQYCAHCFTRNWQLPFLNQGKREKDRRKYLMIHVHERMLLTRRGLNPQPPGHQSDVHPSDCDQRHKNGSNIYSAMSKYSRWEIYMFLIFTRK